MTLLSDIESATEGSPELGARALNALSRTSDFGVLNGVVYFLIPPSPFSDMHQHAMRDISSDFTELWAECLRRGYYPNLGARNDGTFHAFMRYQYYPCGTTMRDPCLALLAALLRAQGVGDE